jgi:hypothetical protein
VILQKLVEVLFEIFHDRGFVELLDPACDAFKSDASQHPTFLF